MRRRSRFRALVVGVAVLAAATGAFAAPGAGPHPSVLVFSKTAGFRHGSIPAGIAAVRALGAKQGLAVDATEDAARFTDEGLAPFGVVVFLSTTGDVLDDDQQGAFERFVQRGGGFVGIHAASDTEFEWPWFGRLVGAYFRSHPRVQDAAITVVDRDHPSTRHLPPRWERRDEWYDYRDSPRGRVHVLATLDESTYEGGGMGADHPIAWCHEFAGGRAWYTGGGHTEESFAEPLFMAHVLGGIRWAAGADSAEVGAPGGGNGAVALFDGRTLAGWRPVGGGATYVVENGCILGEVGPGPNTFLRTERTWRDFELTLEVRLDVPGNSGVQFRSHQRPGDGRVYGYQCEIDPTDRAWSGGLYDEGRRGWLVTLEDRPEARAAFRPDGWNAYRIRAVGSRLTTWVNGVRCAELVDDADREGFIALQVHSGERGRIRWRNIRLREIEDASGDEPEDTPGPRDG